MSRTAVPNQPTSLPRLRTEVGDWYPLRPLGPLDYAIGHALFEARSDQRGRITEWLVRQVAARATGTARVLSIGCGDGSVDRQLAAALTSHGEPVDYVGVEPNGPIGRTFRARLDTIPGVHASLLAVPFERARPEGLFDMVIAVHSLYYVADLAATLRRATRLLAPGGELFVLHAPREPLNVFVGLTPGPRQGFSDEVAKHLRGQGEHPEIVRIDSELDLTPTGDAETDRRLLSFTVQAEVPEPLVPLLRRALGGIARPGAGLVLPHPVDALVVRR